MKVYCLYLVGAAIFSANATKVFIDDLGFEHTCVENPKIILSAQMAVSMHHLGMPDEMMVAHYGLPFGRASKGLIPGVESQYETDAQLEDVTWLKDFPSLSPECWEVGPEDRPMSCGSLGNGAINFTILDALEIMQPDFIAETPRRFSTVIANNATEVAGANLIYIDSNFEGEENCRPDKSQADAGQNKAECFSRSSVKTLERYEELAECWGFEISEEAKSEKEEMCTASKRLTNVAKEARDKGIRIMAASIFGGTFYITNPGAFHSLRSMEALGLPIMWPGSCPDVMSVDSCYSYGPLPGGFEVIPFNIFYRDCAGGNITEACVTGEGSALYPVDFWILEGTSYTNSLDGVLQQELPDPALTSGQFYYIDANEGVLSYRAVTDYFNTLSDRLQASVNLHNDDGQCTDVNYSHGSPHTNFLDGGLEAGQFVCFIEGYHDNYCSISRSTSGAPSHTAATVSTFFLTGAFTCMI